MKTILFTVALASLVLCVIEAKSRVKRDAWRTWEGVDVNCDSSPKGNPCVTCACQKIGHWNNQDYNTCREDTKHCHKQLTCADSIVKPGECCPSCPNGPNCLVYGSVVTPSEDKIFRPGSTSEYSVCGAYGNVKVCTITTQVIGSSTFQRHQCVY